MSAAALGPGARPIERLVLGAALLGSAALVWLVTGELLAVAVFAAGLIGLGGLAWFLTRRAPNTAAPEFALPDWSVTVAAIDRADAAIAVTDRAGRLVCANPLYEPRSRLRRSLQSITPASNGWPKPGGRPGAMAGAPPIWSRARRAAGKPVRCAPGAAMTIWSGQSRR
jgi:hypothetical protein